MAVLNGNPATEQSTPELVQRATEQVSRLIRDEMALARAEMTEKGKRAGTGAGLLGGGGVLALYGLGALIASIVLLLALAVPAWAAALIVAVALFAIAGVLALSGKQQVSGAKPPVPQAAKQSLRADTETVMAAAKGRRA